MIMKSIALNGQIYCCKPAIQRAPDVSLRSRIQDGGIVQKKPVLPSLGLHNNAYMFLCPIAPFLDYYGPCQVEAAALDACINGMLLDNKPIVLRDDYGNYEWTDFRALAKDRGIPGGKLFEPLKRIIERVMAQKRNSLRLCHALTSHIASENPTSSGIIDTWFIEGVNMGPHVHNGEINAPEALERYKTKLYRKVLSKSHVRRKVLLSTLANEDQAQLQVLGACHEILSEDPRRMWIYGLTFENSLVSIWYFSRSHSVKSVAFDWIQDPASFFRVLLPFANASQPQLGIDPTVHLGPPGKQGMTRSYIYEVPREDDESLFFKTLRSLAPEPSSCIAGRTTRVWEVTQVTSADGKTEVNGKKVVLKDVWLDAANEPIKTEADNVDAIFKAVDDFVEAGLKHEIENELRKNPEMLCETLLSDSETMERLMAQFVDHEKRFDAFDDATKKRLRENLTNKKYRSMFLTKLHDWRGVKCRDVAPDARPFSRMFHSWPFGSDAVDALLEEERWGQKMCIATECTAEDRQMVDYAHSFPPRQQNRFIYEEVCTTLQNLDTVGDVVDVLSQTIDVLHVFFAAGWVHRDISSNNIMAYRSAQDQPWMVKLADLEYSRPMVEKPIPDSRIGTPFFMPVEISSQLHFFNFYLRRHPRKGNTLADDLGVKKEDDLEAYQHLSCIMISQLPFVSSKVKLPPNPLWHHVPKRTDLVNHNFHHDLESVWWSFVWIITCRVGCETSANDAAKYFKNSMNDFEARRRLLLTTAFAMEEALHENLDNVGASMEPLRRELLQNYIIRGIFGHLSVPESYSSIHATFATKFREIQAKEGPWRSMRLQRDKTSLEGRAEVGESAIDRTTTGKHRRNSSESNPSSTKHQPKLKEAN